MMTLWTEQLTRAKDRYTKILAYLHFHWGFVLVRTYP